MLERFPVFRPQRRTVLMIAVASVSILTGIFIYFHYKSKKEKAPYERLLNRPIRRGLSRKKRRHKKTESLTSKRPSKYGRSARKRRMMQDYRISPTSRRKKLPHAKRKAASSRSAPTSKTRGKRVSFAGETTDASAMASTRTMVPMSGASHVSTFSNRSMALPTPAPPIRRRTREEVK
ncbi:unnamed protein product [Cylicocyclus nassatus]|uniref:Uncharacterized protein n=1 Tax=Cylicocyclus nassatus TaxID=53992 RepID=A0AA36M3V6_CYLNA|nr:unnamed protein product [Cylicocyclus nassatus]